MKRTNIYLATALSAALALGGIVGCGKQAQDQAKEQKEEVQEQVQGQSQDALLDEFKDAALKTPAYKSVTVKQQSKSSYYGEKAKESGPEELEENTVYKFDESGEYPRTSCEAEIADIKLKYVSNGNDVVCVTDKYNYSGTADQFMLEHPKGLEAYLKDTIGIPKDLVNSASEISKEAKGDETVWTLKLDPEKYMQTNEILQSIAKSEDPITEETVVITFDKDGNISAMSDKTVFKSEHSNERNLTFSDYDNTTVEEMPKADKTFEDFEKDETEKIEKAFTEEAETEKAE